MTTRLPDRAYLDELSDEELLKIGQAVIAVVGDGECVDAALRQGDRPAASGVGLVDGVDQSPGPVHAAAWNAGARSRSRLR